MDLDPCSTSMVQRQSSRPRAAVAPPIRKRSAWRRATRCVTRRQRWHHQPNVGLKLPVPDDIGIIPAGEWRDMRPRNLWAFGCYSARDTSPGQDHPVLRLPSTARSRKPEGCGAIASSNVVSARCERSPFSRDPDTQARAGRFGSSSARSRIRLGTVPRARLRC